MLQARRARSTLATAHRSALADRRPASADFGLCHEGGMRDEAERNVVENATVCPRFMVRFHRPVRTEAGRGFYLAYGRYGDGVRSHLDWLYFGVRHDL